MGLWMIWPPLLPVAQDSHTPKQYQSLHIWCLGKIYQQALPPGSANRGAAPPTTTRTYDVVRLIYVIHGCSLENAAPLCMPP